MSKLKSVTFDTYKVAAKATLNEACDEEPDAVIAEPVKQEPIKFLANSTRFKLSFQDREPDSVGNAGTYVTCFEGWERELDGRWVALVDAEDGRHLAYTHPTSSVVRQLVDAIEPLAHLDLKAGQLEKYDDDLTVYQRDNTKITIGDIRRAQAALAAAKEAGL